MKIGIIGNGSVGSFIACRFVSYGNDVVLYTRRDDAVNNINKHGITLSEKNNKQTYHPYATTIDNISGHEDILIICVKAFQIEDLVNSIQNKNLSKSIIITLMNGLGYHEIINKYTNCAGVYAGLNTYGTTKYNDNDISLAGNGKIVIGRIYPTDKDTYIKYILDMFISAGLKTVISSNIKKAMWEKLCINACINPVTALIRKPNGILSNKMIYFEKILDKVLKEIILVASASDIDIDFDYCKSSVIDVIEKTMSNKSSMLQDIDTGRATEVDYILGFIIDKANEFRLNTDYCDLLYRLIKICE